MSTRPLRIAIVTDAYYPQISGVARTIEAMETELKKRGHTVAIFAPRDFRFKVRLPRYPEIKLVIAPYRKLGRLLDEFRPDALHIAVEGPLGIAARRYAKRRGIHFTTAYHTRFPEYVQTYFKIPTAFTYPIMRWFHNSGSGVMVAAESLRLELAARGIRNLMLWPRGVDAVTFEPNDPIPLPGPRPIFMYMGRVAHEKNIGAFLALDLPGTKYIVGDGPARKSLERKYPDAVFTGYKFQHELAQYLAAADVFVFPSLTDTLGLVMLEANACGTPIAAFPSQASKTVVRNGENGIIGDDLREACLKALKLSRTRCRAIALESGWQRSADLFLENLVVAR